MSDLNNYKIAIIGSREAIRGFKALGFEIFDCDNTEKAVQQIFSWKKGMLDSISSVENKYAIIFITEDLAQKITNEEYLKLTADPLPAIVTIPSPQGSSGFSLARLSRIVEQAVGSDILT